MLMESLLLTATQLSQYAGERLLTRATGFFFARDERLFLVTSGHVFFDGPTCHEPDRVEIKIHTDASDLARSQPLSIALYENGASRWRQASDGGGTIDVAAVEVDPSALPATAVYRAFEPRHLQVSFEDIEVGAPLLIVGFPLGLHDTLHHLPVARQGMIASSFGLRFQGQGYFLTDGRTHRGTSGAPVVTRATGAPADDELPWSLLGVHSARIDMAPRDAALDESLGLNCTWYADVLLTLTGPSADASAADALPEAMPASPPQAIDAAQAQAV
jgi:hypothetical protein